MGLEHLMQPMGQALELAGPAQGGVQVDVNLGQDVVKDQVLELLLVADMMVDGTGDDPQAGGQAAHGQGLDTVLGDGRKGLGDHPLAGQPGRRSWLSVGGSNHSARTLPSVAAAADAAVARVWGAGCCRCATRTP